MDEQRFHFSDVPTILYCLILLGVIIVLVVFDSANPTIRWSDYFLPTFTAVLGAMGAEGKAAATRQRQAQPKGGGA